MNYVLFESEYFPNYGSFLARTNEILERQCRSPCFTFPYPIYLDFANLGSSTHWTSSGQDGQE